jgi:hypothetical protein
MNDNVQTPLDAPAEQAVRQDNTQKQARLPVAAGAFPRAIVPTNMDEAWRVATLLVRSGLAPRDVNTPERAMVAIMTGLELGLPPMTAIQRIAVINGRPCIWGDAVPAVAQRTGLLVAWDEGINGEGDDMYAYCRVTRRVDSESTITRSSTFSVVDAKKAGLWSTDAKVTRKGRNGESYTKDNDSPWYRFPKRMLQMRARVAFRDLFADAMCGLYIAEEMAGRDSDAEMRDVTPRIHNPLQDDAETSDERPPRDIRDDLQAPAGTVILDGDEAARALSEPDLEAGLQSGLQALREHPLDYDPETGEVHPGAEDHCAPTEADKPELAPEPRPKPKTARPRPRPVPRQAPAEPAGEPKAEAAPQQPAAGNAAPGANGAHGVALAQPWIKKRTADYEAYLQQWTAAWVAYGQDPNGLRDRYGAERTIRNSLGDKVDQETLMRWKDIATEAFKKLGGQLQ